MNKMFLNVLDLLGRLIPKINLQDLSVAISTYIRRGFYSWVWKACMYMIMWQSRRSKNEVLEEFPPPRERDLSQKSCNPDRGYTHLKRGKLHGIPKHTQINILNDIWKGILASFDWSDLDSNNSPPGARRDPFFFTLPERVHQEVTKKIARGARIAGRLIVVVFGEFGIEEIGNSALWKRNGKQGIAVRYLGIVFL